ncbi:PLP-dependent aminotransferase family protein [Klebsiella michiganensis]|uniref:MocR-like pyridoxine biosynthesis transcription factor PdxR n=1 Tax=Klebsiella michiganensis TaxID=1134687 RepID=UPI000D645638|nr:PLP-dependent aminotransferase family protein [Klebsiella michiganensis]WKJ97652.1 PLP-dependent aminotransferase family protein [Klebsiella michiganensis]WKK01480.1 PLP-dependent aminotransferase family protein [Klebsiella michiganensis]
MSVALPFDLTGIKLDAGRKRSEQLYRALREKMVNTPGLHGAKLPATRELARLLGVSRNTVVSVYERLYADDLIETRQGDGTYIRYRGQEVDEGPDVPEIPALRVDSRLPLTARFNRHFVHDGPPKAFRIGMPAIDHFPFDTWSRLQNRFWRRRPIAQMGYGVPAGDLQLRELIASYLHTSRGLKCDPAQVIITLGAQQAIMLCSALLLRVGQDVIMENPCHWAAAGVFSCLGLNIKAINVDDEGLQTAQLTDYPDARMVYVSPSCQYPTGATLSLSRRMTLLEWARKHQAWIMEDDYDGEYRYNGTPLMPLAALDNRHRVIYIGSFSKVMYPALRLGYMVVPQQLVEPLNLLRTLSTRQPPMNDQQVMASFISEGHFQPHIRRMRRISKSRRDLLLAEWNQHLSHIGVMPEVVSGLHAAITLDDAETETRLVSQAQAAGVEITPLSALWIPGTPESRHHYGVVLGFAGVMEADIVQSIQVLKKCWQ